MVTRGKKRYSNNMDMILLSEDFTIFMRTRVILMIIIIKREKIFLAKINESIMNSLVKILEIVMMLYIIPPFCKDDKDFFGLWETQMYLVNKI